MISGLKDSFVPALARRPVMIDDKGPTPEWPESGRKAAADGVAGDDK